MSRILALLTAAVVLVSAAVGAQALTAEELDPFRKVPVTEERTPDPMLPQADTSLRSVRAYPEQPPTVPHSIEGYQIDKNANKCLSCHARVKTGVSQAPMVSVTHYYDRQGQALAQVSPRRYFCTQCHVPQHPVRMPVENTFTDIDSMLRRDATGR